MSKVRPSPPPPPPPLRGFWGNLVHRARSPGPLRCVGAPLAGRRLERRVLGALIASASGRLLQAADQRARDGSPAPNTRGEAADAAAVDAQRSTPQRGRVTVCFCP